ncbi:MAG: cell envelope integrity protein CreD, partial [Steroidobacter sp.]
MLTRMVESGSVTTKAVLIGVIVLLLLVPLAMLRGVVTERASLREQAHHRVAEGWGGALTFGGPILIVPIERNLIAEDNKIRVVRTDMYVLPSRLDVDVEAKIDPQPRYVGIYGVPVYLSSFRTRGEFDISVLQAQYDAPGVTFAWGESRLLLPVSSVKSLREVTQSEFAGQRVNFGPAGSRVYPGVEAPIDLSELHKAGTAAFDFGAVVAGSRNVSMLPLGGVTTVHLASNWPHPSFQGAFLPVERNIAQQGFDARWQVLELNRSYRQVSSEGELNEAILSQSSFGVDLFQSVDIYQRAERAVKYAALFIALTFLTLFAWEQVTRNRLHPLQYLLVGLALSMFYLLLIALSEHVAFDHAYLAAATACVALVVAYLRHPLGTRLRAAAF